VTPSEVSTRRTVRDGFPHELARVSVGAQQAHDVARDLADEVALDPAAQACHELRTLGHRVGIVQLDAQRAVVTHPHRVVAHVLLTENAGAVVDPELPVVPGTRQHVAVEDALRQAVALVRAGVVEGVHTVRRPHEAQPPPVRPDETHRPVGEVVETDVESNGAGSGCVHVDEP